MTNHIPDDRELQASISKFMDVVRSRWNFEEAEFDAIEHVFSDAECIDALRAAALPKQADPSREELLATFENAYDASMAHHQGTEPKLARKIGLDFVLARLAVKPVNDGMREAIRNAVAWFDEKEFVPSVNGVKQTAAKTTVGPKMQKVFDDLRAALSPPSPGERT